MAAVVQFYGTGRRKSSTARVYLRPGQGEFLINRRSLESYFKSLTLKMLVKQPFQVTETLDKFDTIVNVNGGGPSGQAGAVRHGISRALLKYDGELRKTLKKGGFLTRDPRIKERKKYGQPGARKRFQFSKR